MQINDSMAAYLNNLSASNVVWSAVSDALNLYDALLPSAAIDAIFITQTLDSSDQVVLENLWIYGDAVFAEVFGFLRARKKFDIMRNVDITRVEFDVDDYVPGQLPTAASRYSIDYRIRGGALGGTMSAVGQNCTALHDFYTRMIMPHFATAPPA